MGKRFAIRKLERDRNNPQTLHLRVLQDFHSESYFSSSWQVDLCQVEAQRKDLKLLTPTLSHLPVRKGG